ncbi:MAG: AAA family ATPase [Kineosporiaceae bacterium]|nr:AAA family ATPase [Kineosporiaceae bacterium]
MYLRELKLTNFRSCRNTTIELRPALTLLVGENNSGKSNVVDALRLATNPIGGRRTRYFETDDFSKGAAEESIQLDLTLGGLTPIQKGQFVSALDLSTGDAHYRVQFTAEPAPARPRPVVMAGPANAPEAEPEKREQITHVYLEPLRDARRELDSADGVRLARIIELLTTPAEADAFVEAVNQAMRNLSSDPVLTKTTSEIQGHLDELTQPVRGQKVGINFEDHRLRGLVRSLRVKMAEHDVELANLKESGLGYANLLFIASVILELRKACDAELTLFLVEEPEAHLHPQLQVVLLEYLKQQAEESLRDDTTGPAGRIQVIATTHSPNLSSGVSVEDVVVLRTVSQPSGDDGLPPVRSTHAIPIARLTLQAGEIRKIDQYLDVTRAALLFATKVLLVEGVAEAVLLPVLARKVVFAGTTDVEVRERRDFRGVTIIYVGSVDFATYIKLLLTPVDGHAVLDRLVVVTDGDPVRWHPVAGDADAAAEGAEDVWEPINRPEQLRAATPNNNADGRLIVHSSDFTLEADLLVDGSTNHEVLEAAYLAQHPRSSRHWNAIMAADDSREPLHQTQGRRFPQ